MQHFETTCFLKSGLCAVMGRFLRSHNVDKCFFADYNYE